MNGLVDSYCRGCVHLAKLSAGDHTKFCDYIGATGKCRPCPAGKGCTVRKAGKRKPQLVLPMR